MPKVVGIDLGNTNTCMAVIEGGKPVILPNAEGAHTTPSIIAFTRTGERLVGEAAKRQAITNPENTISSLMRFIGRSYDDPEVYRDKRLVLYTLVRAQNGDAWIDVRGKHYSPIELLAMLLQKLKLDAESALGEQVTQAVITVPCTFDLKQCQAIRDAGRIAGLEVLRLLRHATAAALAYGLERKSDERVAIYDLGGGTCDIAILEIGDGVFEVKSSNGKRHLGGEDFDQRIITWLLDGFRLEHRIDVQQSHIAFQRVKEAAGKAKKELSSAMQTDITLPFLAGDASRPISLSTVLTRAKLELLVEDLIEQSRLPVMQALSDAGCRPGEVQEVVLVGDQTRMPAVRTLVKRLFDREPSRGVNPDEIVAAGAAIQAGVFTGDIKDVLLLDVTPLSLGIETLEGRSTQMITRNTTIPTQRSQTFLCVDTLGGGGILTPLPDPKDAMDKAETPAPSSADDDDARQKVLPSPSSVNITILQGEREFAKDTHMLGSLLLDGLSPVASGRPEITVTFDIDAHEILNVSARERETGREQKLTLVTSSGLSQEQIERLIREAKTYATEYKHHKEEIEERHRAENAVYRVEKAMVEPDTIFSSEQKHELNVRIADVRAALSHGTIVHIRLVREALELSFQRLSKDISQQRPTPADGQGTQAVQKQERPPEPPPPHAAFQKQEPGQEQASSFVGHHLGNYYVLRRLGQGGFAEVYLGEHRYLKTQAAIKVLQMRMQQEHAIQEFLQEAQAIARLKHRHIVRVLDFGIEDALPFLIMDYAAGGTLRDQHPHGTQLSPATVLPYVRQIASALTYAHQQKIVHRDVKPENMLREADGTVLLSDFGIAVQAHHTNSLPIQEASGTASYMAPEQIAGKARPASDQYSLAMVIYEWLCGRRPFVGTFFEVMTQQVHRLPPSLRSYVPELPLMVEQVVLTALAKDPKHRFANVQAFATAFEHACRA